MNVRELTEKIETETMSPFATLSKNTIGRDVYEKPCELRTDFQRDRDRIIHCKSFRRLKHKTQVFLSPEGDHYRTRLTHTLEVAQIARTIARALRLNEDLTEAISLGHDLGHTPFGHAGEKVLNEIYPQGFHHYEQSTRIVEKLENNGRGLNLTWEVRDGIKCHTCGKQASTPEGRIVRIADKIAYINHDIDDSQRAGIISEDDIPLSITKVLGKGKSKRIDTLVKSVINYSKNDRIELEPEINYSFCQLNDFMFKSVYTNPYAKNQENKVPYIIKALYNYFCEKKDFSEDMKNIMLRDGVERTTVDYIAGMTDQFAIEKFQEIFIPKAWNHF